MPAMRPEDISNLIRLAYEVRAAVLRFIAEDRAVNTLLAGVVAEVSPDEEGISALGSEHDLFAGADELIAVAGSPIGVSIARVVALVESDAIEVSVLREPPDRSRYHCFARSQVKVLVSPSQ
jgi:hypothetical protein